MSSPPVPVIPSIPPISSIADRATRDVLDALVKGWQLRNAQTGRDADRFVTRGEIDALAVGSVRGAIASGGIVIEGAGIGGKSVGEVIAGLTGQITESMLFKTLGERINWIDKPGGLLAQVNEHGSVIVTLQTETAQTLQIQIIHGKAIGDLEAGLVAEEAFRLTNETALSEVLNTLWAAVTGSVALVQDGTLTKVNNFAALSSKWVQLQAEVFGSPGQPSIRTALSQEASVRANRDGTLEAQYTIKIDQNGYVSGFGLASTARNSTPVSEFIVRADRFAIGSPAGPGILDPIVPFIVLTTPTVVDGVDVPAGVYIKDAFIQNATIDTLKIKGGAITETLVASGGTTVTQSITLPDTAEGVLAIAMATVHNTDSAPHSYFMALDGLSNGVSLIDDHVGTVSSVKFIPGGGTHNVSSVLTGDGTFSVNQHNLILMGAKR